jgi:asparagine synthase (glutamine-hydrolysing)
MCGISGIFHASERPEIDRKALRRMNGSLVHRGPDEGGEHFEPGLALGHQRLSIIDVASGQQPLANDDGSVLIVYNGEIYNFQQVAAELTAAGHRFRTRSDTEVIVRAWEEWGEACLERFNGMFAFALWDRRRETLFLARDRLGEKPLYYAWLGDGQLVFGSELKAVLAHPGVRRDLDATALEDYLALGYVPDPKCIFRGVAKLAPGHCLTARRGAPRAAPRRYWNLSFRDGGVQDVRAVGEELIERLRAATRLRLMSEVPLGAFLSGGVDSSAIVAMMAGLSQEPVNTCSISFGDPRFDETAYAQLVADRYRTRHHVERVEADDFSLLDTLVQAYDEPFADSSAVPTYRVCQLARKRVKVALSGDGGDETFAGYRRYKWQMYEERLRAVLPQWLRGPLFGVAGALYPKMDWAPKVLRAKSTLQGIARDSIAAYFHTVSFTPDSVRLPLYSDSLRRELAGYHAIETFRSHARDAPDDALALVQYLDFKTYLPGDILVKVDRASMAHSLEVRVPLLDHTLVEWAATVPSGLKLRRTEGKYVLKKSLGSHLPHEILYRPKMGFAIPVAAWLRGPLRERLRSAVVDGALARSGYFEQRRLTRLVEQHVSGLRDHSASLWALLMLEGFLRLRA